VPPRGRQLAQPLGVLSKLRVNVDVGEVFRQFEEEIATQSAAAGLIQHAGDRGGAREEILREFLATHLPQKYGVAKGAAITKQGQQSHAIDVIIYDAVNCPIIYAKGTHVLPVEGVYGIIEVKSTISKHELEDAVRKVAEFKRLAPRDLTVIQTREYMTMHRPSRPFGAVLAFGLADNSLDSLSQNWETLNRDIHDVNFFANLIGVLGTGLLLFERVDWTAGEIGPLLDTDEFVKGVQTSQTRQAAGASPPDVMLRASVDACGDRTFGRFFIYLLMMLERLQLGIADLGQYLDPSLPITVHRES
jgi:hypothetical protein